ncbi:MAG: SIS domain-containing protein [Ardenticatenaceae bacterium]|nr:SIS domain-containing protein [Ardenticatenaceae bacterium]
MNQVQKYVGELKTVLDQLAAEPIEATIDLLHQARLTGKQIFIMGNGGSASTATHFVCDLAKNTRKAGWSHFKVIGLSDNVAIMTAYSNDEGYENVFAQQLANLVQAGDVVIGISTSGNSPNILRAVEVANDNQATTVGFTGFDAGSLGKMVDIHIHVPSDCIEQVEDIHLMLEHLITKSLREMTRSA